MAPVSTAAAAVAAPAQQPAPVQVAKPRSGANDNRSIEKLAEKPAETKAVVAAAAPAVTQRLLAPENDVERFYKERVETNNGSSVTATQLYEDYCAWCETKDKEPLALPTFGREFGDLGVKKDRIAGRVRYFNIALKADRELEEDKKLTALRVEAA
jgi:phage/plasmid-associated DNA primase